MKQQISFAVAALISSSAASAVKTPEGHPVYPLEFHFNEDYHSLPDPIAGKKYMTATQAKYIKGETWDTDTEDTTINPKFHDQFSLKASEPQPIHNWMIKYWGADPMAVQLEDKINQKEASDSESSSDSDSDSEEEDNKLAAKKGKKPADKKNLQWQVTPDLGELDDHSTLYREWDSPDYLNKMKPKFSGWSNPLSWTDSGDDDEQVLVLMTSNGIVERRIPESSLLQYEEAEGPTKVDFGDADMHILGRDKDSDDYLDKMKPKFHGWSNPLSWTDDGSDDGTVI